MSLIYARVWGRRTSVPKGVYLWAETYRTLLWALREASLPQGHQGTLLSACARHSQQTR